MTGLGWPHPINKLEAMNRTSWWGPLLILAIFACIFAAPHIHLP